MSVMWTTDDSQYVRAALKEWNFRQLACTKPASDFGQLSVDGQSWVLSRAAELKTKQGEI
jgi:hypothetical protein